MEKKNKTKDFHSIDISSKEGRKEGRKKVKMEGDKKIRKGRRDDKRMREGKGSEGGEKEGREGRDENEAVEPHFNPVCGYRCTYEPVRVRFICETVSNSCDVVYSMLLLHLLRRLER